MTGRTRTRNQGIKLEDTIEFLRKSALVKETSGTPALTTKGERFLEEHQESSSRHSSGSSSPDGHDLSDGEVGR
jgi:hypothetical protein